MADNFAGYTAALTDPARSGQNVAFASPAVDVQLSQTCRAIRCGGEGTLVVTMAEGNDLTFEVAAGDIVPVRATHVKATSTATNIVALW